MSLQHIPFLDVLRTGMPEVEDDPRQLVEQYNKALNLFNLGHHRCEVLDNIDQLLSKLTSHFFLEESVLKNRGFPRLAAHTDFHGQIERDLNRELALARHADSSSGCQMLLENVRMILVDAFIRYDLDYKSHILYTSAMQRNSPSTESRPGGSRDVQKMPRTY